MDNAPSFSIDITQIPKSDRTYDYENPNWAENRSKKIHDQLYMKKLKKITTSTPKAKVKKTPQKRGRKVAPTISRPRLPQNMSYVMKTIPAHSLRFGATYKINFANDLTLSIGTEGVELFRKTLFGPYLNIPNCNYQGQITKCLMLLEVEHDNTDELHIRHAKENILHFTMKEFAIITGLKCTDNASEFKYPESTPSRLMQRYFPGAQSSVSKILLAQRFQMGGWQDNDDALQMAILYFIHTFVYSQMDMTPIPIEDFLMVEDGTYVQFPWGQIAFTRFIKSYCL